MSRKHNRPHAEGPRTNRPAARPRAIEKLEKGATSPNLQDQDQSLQRPLDVVDEESMESFPASDPPSHTRSHS